MFGIFRENSNIQKVLQQNYQVVFYAENAYYFQYFRHLFDSLIRHQVKICYISSDANDPVLRLESSFVDTVYSKSTLAFLFSRLRADVMILTMPDLDRYILKRSAGVKKYIYVFHALVSVHQQYRLHAFDHFDTIFCAGPHHEKEIREQEALYATHKKELVAYGYPLLSDLEEKAANIASKPKQVLIAPSWYEEGILQTCILDMATILGETNYDVLIRPHPEFIRRNKKDFRRLEKLASKFSRLVLDTEPSLWNSLLSSSLLITDRSGIAFEFAFTRKHPVVFIDTPLKIQNEEWERLQHKPVENEFRIMLGYSLGLNKLAGLPALLGKAANDRAEIEAKIEMVKKLMVYDSSGLQQGVDYILNQLS